MIYYILIRLFSIHTHFRYTRRLYSNRTKFQFYLKQQNAIAFRFTELTHFTLSSSNSLLSAFHSFLGLQFAIVRP